MMSDEIESKAKKLLDAANSAAAVGNNTMAFQYIYEAANLNYPQALYQLAFLYDTGKGTNVDKSKAFSCLKKAAEQGHNEAQNRLGMRYITGVGIPANPTEGFLWIKKGCDSR